jgi:hypothetical protein
MAVSDKGVPIVAIEIGDVYDLLIGQVLPGLGETNTHLARQNGTIKALQRVVDTHSEVLSDTVTGLSKLHTRVSVAEAVAGERKEHQAEVIADVKEEASETRQGQIENLREIMKVAKDVAVIAGGLAVLANAVGLL